MSVDDVVEAYKRQQERQYELEQARKEQENELIKEAVAYVMASGEPLKELEVIAEHMRDSGRLNQFFRAFWAAVRTKSAEGL